MHQYHLRKNGNTFGGYISMEERRANLRAKSVILLYFVVARLVGAKSNQMDTEEEVLFRKRYSIHLRDKKQQIYDSHMGHNALEEERKQVNQQAMKTPGRRGEIIKNEEIDKEYSRRYSEHLKRNVLY
jgi:hypothetical protein